MNTTQHGIPESPPPDSTAPRLSFSPDGQIQVIVSGRASALEQIRTTIDPSARLCDYSEENGMTDLDDIASEALEQLLAYLGQNPPQPVAIAEMPIPIRAALSDAALESPDWEDDHKVSGPILRELAAAYGEAVVAATEHQRTR